MGKFMSKNISGVWNVYNNLQVKGNSEKILNPFLLLFIIKYFTVQEIHTWIYA